MTPPIDMSRVELIAETFEEQAEILQLFFRLSNELTQSMTYARRDEEFLQWKNAAHSLKGSAANLGMANLEGACLQAEQANDWTYNQRSELLSHIRAELQRIQTYIRSINPHFTTF